MQIVWCPVYNWLIDGLILLKIIKNKCASQTFFVTI